MGFIEITLLAIFIISAIALIFVILIQDDQGDGIGGLFGGGGGSSTPFGSRSGNILTKFTSILATVFILCSFGLAWINKTPEKSGVLEAARRGAVSGEEQSVEWWENTSNETESTGTSEAAASEENSAASDPDGGAGVSSEQSGTNTSQDTSNEGKETE
jgi:preprotein translocase subunit SecG